MAILQIRIIGYKGTKEGLSASDSKLVADLADAVHNIPVALIQEDIDLDFQVNIMLKGFDEKYPEYDGLNPYIFYKSFL